MTSLSVSRSIRRLLPYPSISCMFTQQRGPVTLSVHFLYVHTTAGTNTRRRIAEIYMRYSSIPYPLALAGVIRLCMLDSKITTCSLFAFVPHSYLIANKSVRQSFTEQLYHLTSTDNRKSSKYELFQQKISKYTPVIYL